MTTAKSREKQVFRHGEVDPETAKARILMALTKHVGQARALDMGQLYREVFRRDWRHKHHDGRIIRALVAELRREGAQICSTTDAARGGYYLAASPAELDDFLARMRASALRTLALEAGMRRVSLGELLGQLRLSLAAAAADPETGMEAENADL